MHLLQRLIVVLAACAVSAGALAQVRNIPDAAKRGEMRHLQGMLVEINGVQQRLAPGAQIRDTSNRILVPTALPAGSLVKYVVNTDGDIRHVWVLTADEAKR